MDKRLESIEVHVAATDGITAIDLLQNETAVSRQRLKSAMNKGAVWVTRGRNTQRLRRATRKLQAGDEIHLYYNPAVLDEQPAMPSLVADTGDYSVWNKPFGLRSQGSKWGDHCTVARCAERQLRPQRPAFVVHRLDRAAKGLVLIAHTKRVAAALAKLFSERAVEKRYCTWVAGDFSALGSPVRVDNQLDGKQSVSEFFFVRREGDRSLIDVRIETGRKHQIRRHLAELGFPIRGDRLYGDGVSDGVDLQLTAYLLAFCCPVAKKPVEYRLPGSERWNAGQE